MRRLFYSLAIAGAVFAASSANAALVLGTTSCSLTDISPGATACRGYYRDNLNSGNGTDLADSATVINELLGTSYTGTSLPIIESLPSISGSTINFARPLSGTTIFSVHVGGAKGQASGVGYSGTAFYLFNAGNTASGLDTITFNRAGLSNARLFVTALPPTTTAVPEPATWLMLILGFAAVGGMMRRSPGRSLRPLVS